MLSGRVNKQDTLDEEYKPNGAANGDLEMLKEEEEDNPEDEDDEDANIEEDDEDAEDDEEGEED